MSHKISVIIPCYKQAHLLPQAIESVRSQAADAEIIVVDDGSPDNTSEVAAKYAPQVRCIRQANAGLSAARNTGIRNATRPFLIFLDADDWLLPAAVEAHLAAAVDRIVVTCGGWRDVDRNGSPLGPDLPPPSFRPDPCTALIAQNLAPCHTYMVPRVAFENVGYFNTTLRGHEDWDMWLRIAAAGYPFVPVPVTVAVYRRAPGSMSEDLLPMVQSRAQVLAGTGRSVARGAKRRAALETGYDNLVVAWCRAVAVGGISWKGSTRLYQQMRGVDTRLPYRIIALLLRRGIAALVGGRLSLWMRHGSRFLKRMKRPPARSQ